MAVLGTITLPFLVAALQLPFGRLEAPAARSEPLHLETATIVAALTASAVVGVLWSPRRWLLLAGLVAIVTVPLFTSWFTNPDGFHSAFWGQLDYWLDQQDVQRGNQPGFYYLMLLPIYEFLTLVPALAGAVWLLSRGDRLTRLLVWWFVATLVALSFAGEKMPWLTVHLAVPLAFLAGRALGAALPPALRWLRSDRATAWGWAGAGVAVAAAGLALTLSLRTAGEVSVPPPRHARRAADLHADGARHPDARRRDRELRRPAGGTDAGGGRHHPVAHVAVGLVPARPPDLRYLEADAIRAGEVPEGAVLISASSTLPPDAALRAQSPNTRPYVHRWWFPGGRVSRNLVREPLRRPPQR